MCRHIWLKLVKIPRIPLLWGIRIYQKVLSPDHSFWAKTTRPQGYCPFYPTCSQYGYDAIKKYGLIKGLPKAGWRVLRCNPWTKGGVDEA